jgi:octaprenyl-diphosphate synthase
LGDSDKKRLISLHAKKLDANDSSWIKEKMAEYKTVEQSFELAALLSDEAKSVMSDDAELVAILDSMIKRSF